MSAIQQWLADLALMPDLDIRDWASFRYAYDSVTCTARDLPARLAELGKVSGWLSETSRVVTLHNAPIALENLPLAGEFYRDDLHWQLSCLPRGQWQLHRHRLTPCATAEATHLGEPVEHLQAGHSKGRLRYWRLWEADQDQAPQCRIAVLADIQETHR
ncbi:MAG: hypothetical protein RBR77_13090 [Thauera sp.]|jgi:hypothetical protein|nr:hypothetical protein [Thauera sp.]